MINPTRMSAIEAHEIATELVRQSVPLDEDYKDEGFKITSMGTILDRRASLSADHLKSPVHSAHVWVGKLACATSPESIAFSNSQVDPIARAIIDMPVEEMQQIQREAVVHG